LSPDTRRRLDRNPLAWLRLFQRSRAALQHGQRQNIPGMVFATFGRRLGWKLMPHAPKVGARYVLTPVDILRYFEFEFAWSHLPSHGGRFLDVGSPCLFSLYVAASRRSAEVTVFNPSEDDLAVTRLAARVLELDNLRPELHDASALKSRAGEYDAIWSVSVVEHIAGAYEDGDAVRWMFEALKPGGVLILTLPVDRQFWIEYRDRDPYGLQAPAANGQHFFQRFYDQRAIRERLVDAIGREPLTSQWFGETTAGRFHGFIAAWIRDGVAATVESPRETADHYRHFESWDSMPGVGVAGLVFEKSR
jgi:SAM-dependent methyltransferase